MIDRKLIRILMDTVADVIEGQASEDLSEDVNEGLREVAGGLRKVDENEVAQKYVDALRAEEA